MAGRAQAARLSQLAAMRVRAAVFFFAAWPCFIHAQILHSPREFVSNSTNSRKENQFHNLISCVENLGLSKCVSAYSLWRAERTLEDSTAVNDEHESFSWRKYSNVTGEELHSMLCDGTEKLLQRRSLVMNLTDVYSLELGASNTGLHFDVIKEKEPTTGRGTMKKMHKMLSKMLPLLVIPGLVMSAILPFFLPTLKMMTLAAGMINQMALTGAVFTLMRNHAFGDGPKTKIVYLNEGYLNEKYEPLADTHSEVFAEPNFDSKFGTLETNEFKDLSSFDDINGPNNFKDNSEWGKPGQANVNNMKIFDDINKFNWGKEFSQLNDMKLINKKNG